MPHTASARPITHIVFGSFLSASFAIVLIYHFWDISAGGNDWKQGDWLINVETTHIRRGLFGSAILRLADLSGIPSLYLLGGLQTGLIFASYWLLIRLLQGTLPKAAALCLIASPGFFVVTWGAEPGFSMRKEVLAFLAIMLALRTIGPDATRHKQVFLSLSCALFGAGVGGHEANVLFLPLLLCVLLVPNPQERSRQISAAACALFATLALLYVFANQNITDIQDVCAPLLQRGYPQSICSGAIAALLDDTSWPMTHLGNIISDPEAIAKYLLVLALALLPMIAIARTTSQPRRLYLAYALAVLPFLPLYFVAVDYGRWLSLHVVSCAFLLLFFLRSDLAKLEQQVSRRSLVFFVIVGLLTAPYMTTAAPHDGIILRAIKTVQYMTGARE